MARCGILYLVPQEFHIWGKRKKSMVGLILNLPFFFYFSWWKGVLEFNNRLWTSSFLHQCKEGASHLLQFLISNA